jgi:hypothetical protein
MLDKISGHYVPIMSANLQDFLTLNELIVLSDRTLPGTPVQVF